MQRPSHVSTRQILEELLERRILLLDGSMGALIYSREPREEDYRGARFRHHPVSLKNCTEAMVLSQAKLLLDIHRAYLDAGADVIVPTGGIPMMLFGNDPGANVDGAPILNGVTVVIKAAEMAVKLKRLGLPIVSRHPQSGFVLPSPQALQEFLSHG